MKKILAAALCCFALSANADELKIAGRVTDIDTANQIFGIATADGKMMRFASVPSTEYEFKDKFFDSAAFSDLKKGAWVKIEYFQGTGSLHTADEVKIYKK